MLFFYATEIDAFLKSAQNLKALRRLVPNLSEAKLLSWYELNKEDIRGKLSTPYFKDWFYELLNALSNLPDKASILGAMASVSEADGEIHVSERIQDFLPLRTFFSLNQQERLPCFDQ